MSFGAAARIVGRKVFTALTTDSVDALPFFRIVISTECRPSERTMLSCGGAPSRTWATSWIRMGVPSTTLTGTRLRSSMTSGLMLSRIGYCCSPIFDRPDGTTMFCAVMADVTSDGVSPCACRAWRSRSTITWRGAPP